MHNAAEILNQLEHILASSTFQSAARSGTLLRFLVEAAVNGRADQLKEYTLGAEALGRGASFDPRTDSIARVEASRLRTRLDLYYASEGQSDPLRITLPKGAYVPQFEAAPPAEANRAPDYTPIWKLAAFLAIVIAAVAIWSPWRRASSPASAPLRLEVDLGEGVTLRSQQVGSSSVIVSPDGRRLVFVSFGTEGVPRLMTRLLDQTAGSETTGLAGTEGARSPFFSPDGRWVGFGANGKLWKIEVAGGTPIPLCDTPELLGASWRDDGTIIASLTATGLWQIPEAGGKPVPLEGFPDTEVARWPVPLPGSRAVLFTSGNVGQSGISVFSPGDRKVKPLVRSGFYGRYLPSGHLAYVEQGTLFVVPFDANRLEVTGSRTALLSDVVFLPSFGSAEVDVSRSGALVYRRSAGGARSVISWLDESGKTSPLLDRPAAYSWPKFSPDGSRLAFSMGEGEQQNLHVYDWRAKKLAQLTFGGQPYISPTWTPDGRFLITGAPSGASGGMVWLSADSGGQPRPLIQANEVQIPYSFGKNGRLAFYQRGLDQRGSVTFDLWTVPVRVNSDAPVADKPEPFLVSDAFETYPTFSPDGRWLAYTSLESASYEVYVRAFPDTGRKWQISNRGGRSPRWSPDGRRLYYRSTDNRIMSVDYTTSAGEFHPAPPRLWSATPLMDLGVFPNFEVAPDGRIAALVPVPASGSRQDDRHVTLLLNVLDTLNRHPQAPE